MAVYESYPWYQGQEATGSKVTGNPAIFAQYVQKQGGVRSWNPAVTAPGTVASAGTVWNSTGLDCWVSLSAVSGITAAKVIASQLTGAATYSMQGTVPPGDAASVLVPGPGGVAVTYSGTLSWTWQPA